MAKKPSQNELNLNNDLNQAVPAGLKWLYEMEAVNSPVLQNNLYGNLYAFPHVQDVELIMDKYQKKMLIYVRFTWFVRKFLKQRRKQLIMDMLDQLQELLPSFEFRIIEDRELFEKALKRVKEMTMGVPSEKTKPAEPSPASAPGAVQGSAPGITVITQGANTYQSTTSSAKDTSEADSKKSSGDQE